MKKLFSFILVCCMACIYADDTPVFEEVDEPESHFSANVNLPWDFLAEDEEVKPDDHTPNACPLSYSSWRSYKSNFGMEKIFIRFPQTPAVSQSYSLLTAYAYDFAVLYSFAGYYPPVGNIDPLAWFDEILYSLSEYPYHMVSHAIFQLSNGDWVMDYSAHDYVQNFVLKARAIVTPFNGYTLQCLKPNGASDYFDYFLDHFWIKCECGS